jgi:hypothetical protein
MVNVHELMHIDILHQLFKGTVHRFVRNWLPSVLSTTDSARVGQKRRIDGSPTWEAALDARFLAVPSFQGLKKFDRFSEVTQWTGNEQKAMVRQIVPVLAPIVSEATIHFARALVDFTLHAQYYSHSDSTLAWMDQALMRMDLLKWEFENFTSDKFGFNYPKLHALVHWTDFIRKFGSADGFDTSYFEAAHKVIKAYYKRTNMRGDYESQISAHFTRWTNITAMKDLLDMRLKDLLPLSTKEEPATVTRAAICYDLGKLHWGVRGKSEAQSILMGCRLARKKELRLPHLKRGPSFWRYASTIASHSQLPNLIDALAVFVRQERLRLAGVSSSARATNLKEGDSSWVRHSLVCVHTSVTCYKSNRDNGSNADDHIQEKVRCHPRWQGVRGNWRRDSVWVQEHAVDEHNGLDHALGGKLPGQILIMLTVIDSTHRDANNDYQTYTGALIDVHRLRNQGTHNPRHGMIEVERVPLDLDSNSLGYQRFYSLDSIHRSVHLVPKGSKEGSADAGVYYVNQYVDWDQYASIYDPDFLAKDAAAAVRISKNQKWVRKNDAVPCSSHTHLDT